MLLRRVRHALGPDVKAAALRGICAAGGDLPHAPDAFPFIEALVEDVVLAEIALGPVALAVLHVVAAAHHELADPIAAIASHGAVSERQPQFHQVPAGHEPLQEEAGPRPAGETWIGF